MAYQCFMYNGMFLHIYKFYRTVLKTSKCDLLQFLFKVLAGKTKLSILRHSIYTLSFLVEKITKREKE